MATLNECANPFSTRFTRPDAVTYLFESSGTLNQLVESYAACRFVAQIVGPHGSGKTTLTHAIEAEIKASFDLVRRLTVRGNRSIEAATATRSRSGRMLLIIDGFERLSMLQRMMLVRHCKRSKIGLLITTHHKLTGVPVLFQTVPTLELLKQLVVKLAPDFDVQPELLANIFAQTDGDIRESLMKLYDVASQK